MITLSNFWCRVRGKPPKWTHFEWGFPFAASMEPAGGEPPPDAMAGDASRFGGDPQVTDQGEGSPR